MSKGSYQRCSIKKAFLKISQNLQENTWARVSFLTELQAQAYNFIKEKTLAQVFSCEFAKFLRTPFSQNTSEWLLLHVPMIYYMSLLQTF